MIMLLIAMAAPTDPPKPTPRPTPHATPAGGPCRDARGRIRLSCLPPGTLRALPEKQPNPDKTPKR